MVDVLDAQHPGDVGGLLGGGGRHDGPHTGWPRAVAPRLLRLRFRSPIGVLRPDQERAAVGGGAGHRNPAGLVAPHGAQGGPAPVDGAQGEALGRQGRAVLGLHEQARAAAAEGLDGDVGVAQHHDLGAVPGGVGTGQGLQEAGRGGGAVLVVVDHDQVGHRGRLEDVLGVPGPQGLCGAVLDAGGVQLAGLGAPLGGGPALGVPGAQEGGGRAPHRDPELAAQGGEAVGVDLELSGARQEAAQLGAEGPGGDGLWRQAGPLLGVDEVRERRVLLGPGEQDRGGQRVAAARQEGGEHREGVSGRRAHPDRAAPGGLLGTAPGGALARQVGGSWAQGVGAGAGRGEQEGLAPPGEGVGEQVKRQAGLAGAGHAEDHEVRSRRGALQHRPPGGVRGGQGCGRGGGQEPDPERGAVVVHGPNDTTRVRHATAPVTGLCPRPVRAARNPAAGPSPAGVRAADPP